MRPGQLRPDTLPRPPLQALALILSVPANDRVRQAGRAAVQWLGAAAVADGPGAAWLAGYERHGLAPVLAGPGTYGTRKCRLQRG